MVRKSGPSRDFVCFGAFEADLHAGELRKHGLRVRLQDQPFKVLAQLLEHPGEVVTREELRQMLWSADTFVDFDNSLSAAINKIREALEDSADNPRFVETLARRGYRFIAPVIGAETRTRKTVKSLAILPFENASADPSAEYLSDGITEAVINTLSKLPQLHVMARSTVFRYRGSAADPLSVGRHLNVSTVLTGRVVLRSDTLSIHVELVDVTNGWQLWGEQYNRKLADIFTVQEEIATAISDRLRLKLTGEEKKRLTKRYTDNAEAYQLYLKGRYFWNKRTEEGIKKGIEYFNQAIQSDPRYAQAYTGLADSYNILGLFGFGGALPREAMPKAREAAGKALGIDESLAEAHASLGTVAFYYNWNWREAERAFIRSLELNPGYAIAHQWYGEYLAAMGRLEEAIAELKHAKELDPLSFIINAVLAWIFFFARQYKLAVDQSQRTLELDRSFWVALYMLGVSYEQMGDFPNALAWLERGSIASRRNGMMLGALGHAYGTAGRRDKAQEVLTKLEALKQGRYISPLNPALVHASLGANDIALAELEKAFEDRFWYLAFCRVDPRFDPLRSDPRFQDLLRRIGLAP